MEQRLYQSPRSLPAIDLNEVVQLSIIDSLAKYYAEQPFREHKNDKCRFFFENPNFSYGEAIVYYGLLRHLRPRRVIEVGSGYSTALLLDTLEISGARTDCTCIEPFPELTLSLLRPGDKDRLNIVAAELQKVDLALFDALQSGDMLFIDSTHVSKVGSDVNIIIFEILPRLASGVYVHFHDVFYPFEYPRDWVLQGRCWNEIYFAAWVSRVQHQFSHSSVQLFFGAAPPRRVGVCTTSCRLEPRLQPLASKELKPKQTSSGLRRERLC